MSSQREQTTYYLGVSQNVSFTGSAANSAAFNASTTVVRLIATQDCKVSADGAATSTSTRLKADVAEYFSVGGGQTLSVIRDTADGVLNITEMTQG